MIDAVVKLPQYLQYQHRRLTIVSLYKEFETIYISKFKHFVLIQISSAITFQADGTHLLNNNWGAFS